jgi:predicted MPP superfamily phosphohydrolase
LVKLLRRVLNHRKRAATLFGLLVALMCGTIAWHYTMADPVVRRTEVVLPGLPADAPPIRLLLMSDLHVANPDMPPARLARIVAQVNALKPDMVLIAGDFITDRRLATRHYSYRVALAPLAGLKSRFGTYAVMGNHDHWRNAGEGRRELARLGVKVLDNTAVQVGSIMLGGLDSDSTFDSDIPKLLKNLPADHGRTVVLSHSPDVFPKLPLSIPLTLAGHTHCGQVRWPWGTSPAYMSNFGDRYACGRFDEWGGRVIVTTAGLGTSVLPFRFLVYPDMWLVTLRGPQTTAGPGA